MQDKKEMGEFLGCLINIPKSLLSFVDFLIMLILKLTKNLIVFSEKNLVHL